MQQLVARGDEEIGIVFKYKAHYIPKDLTFNKEVMCYDRIQFLAMLNKWNASMPDTWKYWEDK